MVNRHKPLTSSKTISKTEESHISVEAKKPQLVEVDGQMKLINRYKEKTASEIKARHIEQGAE